MKLSDLDDQKLLLKCFKSIEFEELCDPPDDCKGRIALVFVRDPDDEVDTPMEWVKSRLVLCRWEISGYDGSKMWSEWDGEIEGWVGPVENVVGWSWLE